MSKPLPRIYLDNNATTQIDPLVKETFIDLIDRRPLNASSVHSEGQQAKTLLAKARRDIAQALGCKSPEIIFTSGSTEGLNMILRGACAAFHSKHQRPMRVLSTEIEHACVFETLKNLEQEGLAHLIYLPVDATGAPKLCDFEKELETGVDLVALSAANSETGVKLDLASFSKSAKAHKSLLVIDATALAGKEKIELPSGVDAAVFSSHKFHGPMGCGFCLLRSDFPMQVQSTGGGQEFKRRSGTENIPALVAMAKAFELAQSSTEAHTAMHKLRDYLESEILSHCPGAEVNGSGPRLSNTTNIYFPNVEGDSLLLNLDLEGLSVSLGSACATGTLEPSRVLLKMGLRPEVARASVRFSMSRFTTKEETMRAVAIVSKVFKRLALH